MKKGLKVVEIANSNGFDLIDLTASQNGYPSKLQVGISSNNFESWDEMQDFADGNNLEVVEVQRRDGHTLWVNKGRAIKPYSISAETFGENYKEFDPNEFNSEEDFIEKEMKEFLTHFEGDFEALESYIAESKHIWVKIENCEEGESVFTREGIYYDTLKTVCLQYSHDTLNYSFALIEAS